jgi:hypothetical protein
VMHSRSNPEIRSRRLSSRYWNFGFALGLHLFLLAFLRAASLCVPSARVSLQMTVLTTWKVSKVRLDPCP